MELRKINFRGQVDVPFWIKHDKHEYVLDLYVQDEDATEFGASYIKLPDANALCIRYDERTKVMLLASADLEDDTFEGYALVGRIIH